MRSVLVILAVVMTASLLAGCAMAASPVNGSIWMNVKGPHGVTSNGSYAKVGEASCQSILGIVATGDASIEAACKAAQITKIQHVDFKSEGMLGVYAKFTTIVYGE